MRVRTLRAAGIAGLALVAASPAVAQAQGQPPRQGIYSCVTADGRRLTSDRPIVECLGREQQIHNRDGSVRAVLPPTLTAAERAEKEARERAAADERVAAADAVRRDRSLMSRFPDEAAHQRAREAALDTVRVATRTTESRLRELAVERKPLLDEAEFYKGKALPAKLKQQLDANDAATEAQRVLIDNQKAELVRVNKLYDVELARLKRLWSGTAPGTLDGPVK